MNNNELSSTAISLLKKIESYSRIRVSILSKSSLPFISDSVNTNPAILIYAENGPKIFIDETNPDFDEFLIHELLHIILSYEGYPTVYYYNMIEDENLTEIIRTIALCLSGISHHMIIYKRIVDLGYKHEYLLERLDDISDIDIRVLPDFFYRALMLTEAKLMYGRDKLYKSNSYNLIKIKYLQTYKFANAFIDLSDRYIPSNQENAFMLLSEIIKCIDFFFCKEYKLPEGLIAASLVIHPTYIKKNILKDSAKNHFGLKLYKKNVNSIEVGCQLVVKGGTIDHMTFNSIDDSKGLMNAISNDTVMNFSKLYQNQIESDISKNVFIYE